MFQRIQQYGVVSDSGRWYRPRAYGDRQPDGTWDGWLIFFPLAGGEAIAAPGPETTQRTRAALMTWASGVTAVYLEAAFARALTFAQQPPLISQLDAAEYDALEDAERLETVAAIERTAAKLDEAAASTARAEANQVRRERIASERALAATEGTAATLEANIHEEAARDARAIAADAGRRRRSAGVKAAPRSRATRKSEKKESKKKK